MAKDIRVEHSISSEGKSFRCATTGAYIEKAIVVENKTAFLHLLAAFIYFYDRFCGLKKNSALSHDEIVEKAKQHVATCVGGENTEAVSAIAGHLDAYASSIQDIPIESLLSERPSRAFSEAYLVAAGSYDVADDSETEKVKKPAGYIYKFVPHSRKVQRITIADKPVYLPSKELPSNPILNGEIKVEQDNKSLNVAVISSGARDGIRDEVPSSFLDYFEGCGVEPKGHVFVWSSVLLKNIVDDQIEAQRQKEKEEHKKRVEESKAKKQSEKRKVEEVKPIPEKGRKKLKNATEALNEDLLSQM